MSEAMSGSAGRTPGEGQGEGVYGASDPGYSNASTSPLSFTGRIADRSAHHRWPVVAGAVALLVVAFLLASTFGIKTSQVFGAGDGQRGHQLIEDRFKEFQPTAEIIVFSNPGLDVSDAAFRAVVEPLVEELRSRDKVASVASYYDTGLEFMVSEDRHVLMARLIFEPEEVQTLTEDYIDPIINAVTGAGQGAARDGFEIEVVGAVSTGKAYEKIVNEDFNKTVMITLVGGSSSWCWPSARL